MAWRSLKEVGSGGGGIRMFTNSVLFCFDWLSACCFGSLIVAVSFGLISLSILVFVYYFLWWRYVGMAQGKVSYVFVLFMFFYVISFLFYLETYVCLTQIAVIK